MDELLLEGLIQLQEIVKKDEPLPKGVLMRVRGKCHHAGKITSNGNLYLPERFQKESTRLQPMMEAGEVLMWSRHPRVMEDGRLESLPVDESTGTLRAIDVLPLDDGTAEVYLEADIGETDRGKNIAALVRMGAKVPISSRARGTANKLLLTDKHPLAKANLEWIGKKANLINEDFFLKTFDWVSEAASQGSKSTEFREEHKEDSMDFDIAKLTKEQWESILGHESVKKLIDEAVKAKEVELNKEFEETAKAQMNKQIEEFMGTDQFKKLLDKKDEGKDDKDNKDDKLEAKCAECKGVVAKGQKYCPGCGAKVVAAKGEEKTPDQKDKQIEELVKKLDSAVKVTEDLKVEVKGLKDKNKDEEDDAKIAEKVEELLVGQSNVIINKVRGSLERIELTEENVKEIVEAEIADSKKMMEVLGIDPEKIPKGEGKVLNEDVDEKGKKKGDKEEGELNEEQRNQQDRIVTFN